MSEQLREGLSALVDGETDEQEAARLLDRITRDAELKAAWERYHLVSDVLRNDLPLVSGEDLVERVRRSVETEPVMFRPRRPRAVALKPVAGFALAASVAVVAVLGFRGMVGPSGDTDAPVALAGDRPEQTQLARMRWDVDRPGVEERLNTYLVNHNEHTARGMLPYARVVAYNADR